MRGLCAVAICRKLSCPDWFVPEVRFPELYAPEPASPAMYPHCVLLNTLYASARNSNEHRSLIGNRLYNDMSKLSRFGLFNEFRPESPNVSAVGAAKALGLYS